jgi:hypothetical protein
VSVKDPWQQLQNKGKGDLHNTVNVDIIMYTVKEIRQIFKCSLSQAYELVNTAGFPTIIIGRKKLVEKKALENWIEKSRGKRILL